MTDAPLFKLDAVMIAAMPSAALESTAVALAAEIDRFEALLAAIQCRLAQTPTNSQTEKDTLHALS